jgi:hypothetical protein
MIFPERILKNIIDYFVNQTIDNYILCLDKPEESYLYDLFGKLTPNSRAYDYFENATAIFTRDDDHPRKIETHLFYNRERFNLPTIHIAMPGEQISKVAGLGYDMGYLGGAFQPSDPFMAATTHSRMFQAKYQIVFTSENTHEVLIMYNWFKCCAIGNIEIFEWNGLHNTIMSGSDIILNEAFGPVNIYSRAISLDCMYEITAPNFNKYQLPSRIEFDGSMESDDIRKIKFKGTPISD